MEVVAHEAIDMDDRLVAAYCSFKVSKKTLSISIVPEDVFLFVATRSDVVEGAGIFYSQRACHFDKKITSTQESLPNV